MKFREVVLVLIFNLLCIKIVYCQDECIIKWEADSLLKAKSFEKAIEKYNLINSWDNFYKISICYCQLGEIDSAANYFNKALSRGFYYKYKEFGLENDSFLKCLKEHSNYLEFCDKDSINRYEKLKNINIDLQNNFLKREEDDQAVRNTEKRIELKKIRFPYIEDFILMTYVDSINMVFLDSVLNIYKKWPGIELLGYKGDKAAWLIAQHADYFVGFQEKCYKYLLEAYKNNNTDPNNVAYLYDRIMINKGLTQKYATQMRIIENEIIFINMDSLENVEVYRNCYGLPPLSFYKKALEDRYMK